MAPIRGVDGTAATPVVAFTAEINSGVYRAGANDVRLTVGGVDALKLIAGGVSGPLTFPNVSTAFIASTGANGSLFLQGNRNAADPSADVLIGSTVARTAGLIADFHNPINAVSKLQVDYQGLLRLTTQAAAIQPANLWTAITPNAGWTAGSGLAYWKDASGMVHLKGTATSPPAPTSLTPFTLPGGFRPAGGAIRSFPLINVTSSLINTILSIDNTGVAGITGTLANSAVYAFDAIHFLAET